MHIWIGHVPWSSKDSPQIVAQNCADVRRLNGVRLHLALQSKTCCRSSLAAAAGLGAVGEDDPGRGDEREHHEHAGEDEARARRLPRLAFARLAALGGQV